MSERHILKSIPTKILLPIDFSPSSQVALETAADLALHFHAELFLLNVLPFFSTFTSEYAVPQVQFQQQEKTRAEKHLAKARQVLTARGVKAGSSVELANDVAGCIMEAVEREQIDMVVISTHGISGWPISCRPTSGIDRSDRSARDTKMSGSWCVTQVTRLRVGA